MPQKITHLFTGFFNFWHYSKTDAHRPPLQGALVHLQIEENAHYALRAQENFGLLAEIFI